MSLIGALSVVEKGLVPGKRLSAAKNDEKALVNGKRSSLAEADEHVGNPNDTQIDTYTPVYYAHLLDKRPYSQALVAESLIH